MAMFFKNWPVVLWFAITMLGFMSCRVDSEPTQDKQALLSFLSQTRAKRLRWNSSDSACNWVGVSCDVNRSFVRSLRLPGVGLLGRIPNSTIGQLTQLRILSLRSNRLSGQIPSDFSNLKLLRSLYLQQNRFSGEFPSSIPELTRLVRLDLSGNNFTGSIPVGLNNLSRLTGLFLENNGFTGNLPSISQASLVDFNVSNNNVNGSIPSSLSRFPLSAFAGNTQLCGKPLPPCGSFPPAPSPPGKKSAKLATAAIIGISVGSAVLFPLLLLVLIICLRRGRRRRRAGKTQKPPALAELGTSSSKEDMAGGSMEVGERNRLVFFDGGVYSFDLEDLLRASAEVLGRGSVGTSYKAVLEEGTTVVVKRLKDVAVTKREFEAQMEGVGKINHQNVVPLRAYYYSKDEKLLVSDFMSAGSLSALLHGSRGSGRPPLDWDNRRRIATSTAKGLAHLHVSGKIVHGNLKASNILFGPDHDACVADFGLTPLFATSTPPNRAAGYRAPEVVETRKVTFKSDVYSFGVLLLELLTGKSPNQASLGEEGVDLPRWVQSVVREEWTAEVFDAELTSDHSVVEEEMVQLLQIAMSCVSVVPDQRPSMAEVVRMVEAVSRGEIDDGLRQPSDEPSRAPRPAITP